MVWSPPSRADVAAWTKPLGRLQELQSLTGDVSPRRYYRLCFDHGGAAILAAYPESLMPAFERFLRTTELLESIAVRVPSILQQAPERGWMAVEDLGSETLFDLPSDWTLLAPYYRSARRVLERVDGLPADFVASFSQPLDRALLEKELEQTWERFLLPREVVSHGEAARRLERALSDLCGSLAELPPRPCHRDFMVRNLVPLGGGEVAVLDHQDLRLGPPHYDLASLLNDSRFPRPAEVTLELPAETVDYHRAAAQRTLKAVGTYAAFADRGFDRHLPLIEPTYRRALEHLAKVPETAPAVVDLAQSEVADRGGAAG
ncbi:MAG: phosphotransferase [Acidobacteriota bacterium]